MESAAGERDYKELEEDERERVVQGILSLPYPVGDDHIR